MIDSFDDKLSSLSYLIEKEVLDRDFIDEESFIIKGRLVFVNGWTLDFREFKAPDSHDYRFHLMDENNGLVRRWDSAPHHDVETSPFHVHIEDKVEPSKEKNMAEVLELVENLILKQI